MSRRFLVRTLVLLLVCGGLLVGCRKPESGIRVRSFPVAEQARLEACLFEERVVTIRLDLGQGSNALSVDPPEPANDLEVDSAAIYYSEQGCDPTDPNLKARLVKWVVECTGSTSIDGLETPCLSDGDQLIIRPKDTTATSLNAFAREDHDDNQQLTMFNVPAQGHFATSTSPYTVSSGLPNPDFGPRSNPQGRLAWIYEIEVRRNREGGQDVFTLDPTIWIKNEPSP